MVTVYLFHALYFSQCLHFPSGIFQSRIPLPTSWHLQNKSFLFHHYWQQNLNENLYAYSHFERTGNLNTEEAKVSMTVSFSSWHVFFPFLLLHAVGWGWRGCIRNNFKVYIHLTHHSENNHALLVLNKAAWNHTVTFLCHWKCCLIYITLSSLQVLIINSNCLFKPFSLMPWQTYTSVTLDKCLLHLKEVSERIISLNLLLHLAC